MQRQGTQRREPRHVLRQERRQLPRHPRHGRRAGPLVQHLLPGAGGPAGQRGGPGPHVRADGHDLRPADPELGGRDRRGNFGSFTLGAEATSPLDLANAYATLGAQGTRCTPTPVVQVLDRSGEPLTRDDGQPVVTGDNCAPEAVPVAVANTLSQILVGDVATPAGTGTRAAIAGHEIAGKTGTSQGRDSVAFVGFMPEYAASVMVFNPKAKQDVGGFGGNMPATIWRNAMAPFLADKPTSPFPPADQALLNGGRPAPRPAPAPDRSPHRHRLRRQHPNRLPRPPRAEGPPRTTAAVGAGKTAATTESRRGRLSQVGGGPPQRPGRPRPAPRRRPAPRP
ncbi:penicillin-binding transpeptidase domain-containing protein [Blastococcus brunescens]|uniref:Penicillin-binding transpeptidase domain-containing protein n=1 Tax=Blastococcus brunescens TaxID=1564165 RepID=A0ABZ1B7K8_9ACTN|nr:penicillin-binding transpeptidase domain-containing protein [Blastococcus sp. BMG 8361]WRL66802.1 penicillin-binding transpeptidase domain-containing protein [Blastococcus sp. BMG 8361]